VTGSLGPVCRVAHEEFGHALGKFTDSAYRYITRALIAVRGELTLMRRVARDQRRERLGRELKPHKSGEVQKELEEARDFKRLKAEEEALKYAVETYAEDAAEAVIRELLPRTNR
jgi:hypothetical protein